jgi:antitoxin VapB
MADVAKIFMNGGSQAVRLPKRYRFEEQSEVLIYREGQRVVLEPRRKAWSRQFRSLAGVAGDLPYPEAPPPVEAGPDLDPGS